MVLYSVEDTRVEVERRENHRRMKYKALPYRPYDGIKVPLAK